MLVGFFIGAFIGTLFGGNWMPLFLGCLGALIALMEKSDRELAPYNERECRRQLKKRGEAKRRAAQRARASTLAGSTTAISTPAHNWQEDDDDVIHAMSDSGILTTSSLTSGDEPLWFINPASGLPMVNNCLDVGGNAFGCSAGDDWLSDNFADSHIDDSTSNFDDSFSSFDDW